VQIVCQNCKSSFDWTADGGSSGPPADGVCPRCGAAVDVRWQVRNAAARTTEPGAPHAVNLGGPGAQPLTLGDYEILDEISRGAMGVVYRARHRQLQRVVALKLMIAGEHASQDQVARFEKEARAAARLRHPNIVPIYDFGVDNGRQFFTMDFIDGTPLDALIARKELTPRRALEITADLADALAYAHARGVVHRDIKPSNIMVDRSGRPQITDFGLAKQLDSDTKFTRTGTTIGTPSYMSPEQAQGENDKIDQRSDVYSLGAVMYEMLTGRPPFTGETMMNIVMKVVHDEPLPLRRINPKLHRDIQTVVLKAIEKEPGRRYQSMADLADDVRRYIAGEMIAARPAGVLRRAGKALRTYRAAIIVGLVIAVIAFVVSGTVIHVLIQRQERIRLEAERERMLRPVDEEPEWVVQFTDDFAEPDRDPAWVPSDQRWKIQDGRFVVNTQPDSYVTLEGRATDGGTPAKDWLFKGNVAVEFTASASSADARINCFLGNSYRDAYMFRFGNWDGNNMALLRFGNLLAEVACPPIRPNVTYSFRIERRNTSLVWRVSDGRNTHELRYDDPDLFLGFGKVRFGFHTWASSVAFDNVKISRELFKSENLSKLQAINAYSLSEGKLEDALAQYKGVIEQYRGKLIAALAEFNCGLIMEALGRNAGPELQEALTHYRNVDAHADLLREKHADLLARNKERTFFVLIEMGRYEQAVTELAALRQGGGTVDAGSAWKFPAILSRCAGDRAYGPALAIMENVRFDGPGPTLREQDAAAGPQVRDSFAKALLGVCTGFADQGLYEQLKAAFNALPGPAATGPFETAIGRSVAAGDAPAALDLLLFARKNKMASGRIEQTALALAERFIASKQYARLTNVHTAYPARGLAAHFSRAVLELVDAGELTQAMDIFKESCERFSEERASFVPAAGRLLDALLAAGKGSDVRAAYAMFGDPRFAGRLAQAFRGQLEADELDAALATLDYIRSAVPELAAKVDRLAADLAGKLVAGEDFRKAVGLFEKFPGHATADALAGLMTTAARADRHPLTEDLMTVAIVHYSEEPKAVAATLDAARTLIEAGQAELVWKTYGDAAKAKEKAKDEVAALRLGAAETLLAGKAYDQAADAYLSAARTPPANALLGATALVKAGVLYQFLGRAAATRDVWKELQEKYPEATAQVNVARLMTGSMPPADFKKWAAAEPLALPSGEAELYLALRAMGSGNGQDARELLRKAISADEKSWFREVAQAMLPKPPGTEHRE